MELKNGILIKMKIKFKKGTQIIFKKITQIVIKELVLTNVYFFLFLIHFSISPAQNTMLDIAKVSPSSYKDKGWVLKISLKKGM